MTEGINPIGSAEQSGGHEGVRWGWDTFIIGLSDVPWGLIIAALALGFILFGGKDGLGKAAPMLTASGLFGIGHGIHTAAKVRQRR